MSDDKEQIHYITIFELIPPFFGALLGGLLGLLLSWLFGLNTFLCLAIGGYSCPMLLLVIFLRLENDKHDPEFLQRVSWRGLRSVVSFYLVVATIALIFVALWPLKSRIDELREQRERQSQPQAPRG